MNTMMINNKNEALFNGMPANHGAAPALRSTEEYEMLLKPQNEVEPLGMRMMRGLSTLEVALVSFIHSNRSGDEFAAFAPALKAACNHDAMRWFDGNTDMRAVAPCGVL